MVTLLASGKYQLIETKNQTKILILDRRQKFAWINAQNIGEILAASYRRLVQDCVLAIGAYRLYDVEDEARYNDVQHLELYVGEGVWQGYLLPTGLPDEKKRNRVIPTRQVITDRVPVLDKAEKQVSNPVLKQ